MDNRKVFYQKQKSSDSFVLVGDDACFAQPDVKRRISTFEMVTPKQLDISDKDEVNSLKPQFQQLTKDQYLQYFDVDGRVVQEEKLRQDLFHGGCDPKIRKSVWSFIFGLYPMSSTERERADFDIEHHYKYHALKLRWQMYMGDSDGENLNEEIALSSVPQADFMSVDLPPFRPTDSIKDSTHIDMAKTYAWKEKMDQTPSSWYRVIDKDIPRTDLNHEYFKEALEDHKRKMRDILITFGFFHPTIGYVQGMNDILTRFLVAMECEVDAFWCFTHHMERIEQDFDENGMVEKMELVQSLLKDLEPNLYSHLSNCNVADLIFCHRWLLVSFKREFDYDESIQYFEMAQSNHLELDSAAAVTAKDTQLRIEVMNDKGKSRFNNPLVKETNYTFEVFVCVAIIMLKRQMFLACKEASDVFEVACNIRGTICLQEVHAKAYNLFFKYCKKSVSDEYNKGSKTKFFSKFLKMFPSISWK